MRAFIPQPAPVIALAVHRAADPGTPEHQIGQGLIVGQVEQAMQEHRAEAASRHARGEGR